jgi:hypothetical protein
MPHRRARRFVCALILVTSVCSRVWCVPWRLCMRAARCSSASFFSDTLHFMRADLVGTITEDGGLILNSPIQPGMISRQHARLEFVFEHAHWKLVDMNSMNGCLYNGVRVKESKLSGKIPTHFPIHWSARSSLKRSS